MKIQIGSAVPYEGEAPMEIKGRNLVDGLPKNIMVEPHEIREALADPLEQVMDCLLYTSCCIHCQGNPMTILSWIRRLLPNPTRL